MKSLLLALMTCLLSITSVQARDVTEAEKAALVERAVNYQQAFIDKDYEAILDGSSPRFYAHIAEQAGVTVPELRAFLIQQSKTVMATATIEAHELDLENTQYLQTKSGAPYALIPTRVVLNIPEKGRLEITRETLALLDEDKWWLMRINDASQVSILQQVYPSFENITFKRSETRSLD